MPTIKLSAKNVATLPAPKRGQRQAYYWDVVTTGFGLEVGATGVRAFVILARMGGKRVRSKVATLGAPHPKGGAWTLPRARQRAVEMLGQIAGGISPNAGPKATAATITLRAALTLHLDDMQTRRCAPISIETVRIGITKYFARWLNAPIIEITAADLLGLHQTLSSAGKTYLANHSVARFSALWNTVDRLHELPARNPATRVRRNKLRPSGIRLSDEQLPGWYRTVTTLSPMRRDFQLLVLFTGLRSLDARHIRWDEIDFNAATLRRPSPKGGQDKAFTLPLPPIMLRLLADRRQANGPLLDPYGGDHGWVFPSLSRTKPHKVQPLAQPKELRAMVKGQPRAQVLPGPHVLRRTYISIGTEIGVPALDMSVLANHSFSTARVQDQYVRQSLEHLAKCQAKIAEALMLKLGYGSA